MAPTASVPQRDEQRRSLRCALRTHEHFLLRESTRIALEHVMVRPLLSVW